MNYREFTKFFIEKICFSINQVKAWHPDFNQNNLSRWVKRGLLIKLRNGYYSFPEYLAEPGVSMYIANRIYRPSYVSLYSALAYYGLIPEMVVQVTSVTTLKTASFENQFAAYSYKSVMAGLFFGYVQKPFSKGIAILIAEPEKAILDLLYLYPFYNSMEEITELRFDETLMHEIINTEKLSNYTSRFNNNALVRRVKLLKDIYDL